MSNFNKPLQSGTESPRPWPVINSPCQHNSNTSQPVLPNCANTCQPRLTSQWMRPSRYVMSMPATVPMEQLTRGANALKQLRYLPVAKLGNQHSQIPSLDLIQSSAHTATAKCPNASLSNAKTVEPTSTEHITLLIVWSGRALRTRMTGVPGAKTRFKNIKPKYNV